MIYFGFWVYLMTDCILFATLFATYAVLGPAAPLDLQSALVETLLLLTASFLFAIAMKQKRVLLPLCGTFLLSTLFVCKELAEFIQILAQGKSWETHAVFSSYFSLVGLHGLHVIVGLFLLAFFMLDVYLRGPSERILRRLTCLRLYWHFLYLIWIFTFVIVYLIGGRG